MKKLNIKALLALALGVVMLMSAGATGFAAPIETDITAGLSQITKEDTYITVEENGGKRLCLNAKTTNFYIENIATGEKVYAFPQFGEEDPTPRAQQMEMQSALVVTVWDPGKKTESRKNTYALSVMQNSHKVYGCEDGFLIIFELKTQKLTVGLRVTLKEGKLYCSVPAASIKEEAPESAMLLKVAVLPFMIRGEANTEGEIILPDGSGEVLDFGTTKASANVYLKPIYGRNLSTTLSVESKDGYDITCPYLALRKGGIGLLAIPEKGAAVGYVNAAPAGKLNSYANAYFSYDYRASDIAIIGDKQTMASQSTRVFDDDVYEGDFTVSYSYLFGSPALSDLAELYGEYLVPDKDTKAEDHTAVVDIYGFVNEQKSFFGFPYTAVSRLSYPEDILALAERDGLSGITLNLKNMTRQQQKGTIDTSLTPLRRVMKSGELKALCDSGAKVYIDADPITFSKNTLSVNSFFSAAKTIYGAPVALQEYRESTHMVNKNDKKKRLLRPDLIGGAVEKLTASAEKLGIAGFASDTLGSITYHDHSGKGTLEDTLGAMEAAIAAAGEKTGLILSAPHDYAIKYCSAITDIPTGSSNNDMCSGDYPFLQMALGGRVCYTVEPINLNRSPETAFLRALATGSALRYSYILSDTEPIIGTELNYLYSADYSSFEELAERQYAAAQQVEKATEGSGLKGYSEKDGILTATFKNGAKITVNLKDKTYTVG